MMLDTLHHFVFGLIRGFGFGLSFGCVLLLHTQTHDALFLSSFCVLWFGCVPLINFTAASLCDPRDGDQHPN